MIATRADGRLHLPISLLAAMELLAEQRGISLEQCIAQAVHEDLTRNCDPIPAVQEYLQKYWQEELGKPN